MEKTVLDFGREWIDFFTEQFEKPYMKKIYNFVKERRKSNIVYPETSKVLDAYRYTHFNNVKVCIIGQDPYLYKGEAHGLSFSTENGSYTPSLRQIERAVRRDLYSTDELYVWNNNLTRWANQGVFLLNAVLTVDAGKSNSHKGAGWEIFTGATVKKLSDRGEVVFMLWGNDAKVFETLIDTTKNLVIKCEHPVAASYKGTIWNNNNCFNRANNYLTTFDLNRRIRW